MQDQDPQPRAASGGRFWGIVAGCAIVFGVFLLVGLACGLYGVYWFFSPGRQMPTSLAVGPASVGVVRLERGDTDAGIQALAEEAMDAVQRAQIASGEGTVPPFLQRIREWQLSQRGGSLGMWVPREATLSLEPAAEGGEVRAVAAINFHGMVRPIGTFVQHLLKSEKTTRVVRHGDQEVLVASDQAALCLADGTLLFGSKPEALLAVLDRWRPAAPEGPSLPLAVRDLAGRFDVYGSLQRPEEARAFLDFFSPARHASSDEDRPWIDALERARFGLDVRSADEVEAMAELVYESPAAAAKAREGLVALVSGFQQGAGSNGLTLKGGPGPAEGAQVKVELELSGLREGLRRWSAETFRSRRRR
jgi:hypothetical protein